MDHLQELSQHLSQISVHELMDKIQYFRSLNIKKLTDNKLRNEILNVLSTKDLYGIQRSITLPFFYVYPKGTLLYRIRKITAIDRFPCKEMRIYQDAWNPPSQHVKRGRLNKPHESLLYVCINIMTAIAETRTSEDDNFALIVYEAKEDIKATCIGIHNSFKEFSSEERVKLRMIADFLKDEFSRDVGHGTEYLYRISEIIAKDYFDLPPREFQDAWCYPSVASKPSVNLCFRPEVANEILKLKGIQVISGFKVVNDQISLRVRAIVNDTNDGKLQYHPVGTEVQKKLFPEIIPES